KAIVVARRATAATDEISLLAAKYRISFANKRQSYASATGRLLAYFFLRRAFFSLRPLRAVSALSIANSSSLRPCFVSGASHRGRVAAACPGFAAGSTILRRHFAPFQRRAAAKYGSRNTGSMAAFSAQPRKLLFQFAALLTKPFVNVGTQCKQRVNVHTF